MALRKTVARKSKVTPAAAVAKKGRDASSATSVVDWLERTGTKATRDGMARYGIPSTHAFGIPVGVLRSRAKILGRDHELAAALWKTGWYEARMLASFVDDPALVTPKQMDSWCREFDNWAICDTVCFHLFDRSPHAWKKLEGWAKRRDEFVKRAAFALLASLSVHDKRASDEQFLRGLAFVEDAAPDPRNFVKKAVNWALRSIGKRNPALNAAATKVAKVLAESEDPTARWVGKDALRELTSSALQRRLSARAKRA
jgi:3-methyladenine DNA glycosylase AlkD